MIFFKKTSFLSDNRLSSIQYNDEIKKWKLSSASAGTEQMPVS